MKLSIIIPAYNEEGNVEAIFEAIKNIFNDLEYEIIFVNDGSKDNTYKELKKIYSNNKDTVKVVNFSRNFGKESAMYAGLKYSTGKYISIIDADMQQNPKYLLEMLDYLEKHPEYDQVAMVMSERKEKSFLKRKLSSAFYDFINSLSDTHFQKDASDFRMFTSEVKDAILSLNEKTRFSKGIFSWVGFNTKFLKYKVEERKSGKSKFNMSKGLKYALDGVIGYSVKPLKLSTYFGLFTASCGFIYLVYIIIKSLTVGIDTPGFATIVCLILFIGGVQLISIGILGEYLAKTFTETKNRPIFIEKDSLGLDEEIL